MVNQEIVQVVNARELHAFLEVGKKFADWITERINKYNFTENQDFICFPILGSKGRGGHNRKEYHLTLDVAKELSMIENNKKGREARCYFIECEKRLKSQPADCDRDTRFDLPHYWDEMKPAEKALYLLGPIHARLVEAFRLEEENKSYKALIAEAKRVLENPVTKAA